MISPELLRRYPFFGFLDNAQLREVAMIAERVSFKRGETILHEGETAEALFFLMEGAVDLYYKGEDATAELPSEIPVGEINPGEPFGISALIEPHILTSTVRAAKPSMAIKIEAVALRDLFKQDRRLAYVLTRQAAKAVMERLHFTRTQLAAALA